MSTIAVDFDGVIHKYSKGWHDGTIYDAPIDGAIDGIRALMRHHSVFVFTSRSVVDVATWLSKFGLDTRCDGKTGDDQPQFWDSDQLLVTNRKLPAVAYIDDRAVHFLNWDQAWSALFQLGHVEAPRRPGVAS